MSIRRQIVAMGGDAFFKDTSTILDRYVVGLAHTRHPTLCYIGTASGDDEARISGFYRKFSQSFPDCRLTHLPLFNQNGKMKETVARSDIFLVGGGNTTNLIALWRAWGVDMLLRDAYEKGKIFAGISAGANCLFSHYVDDCSGTMDVRQGLGWLEGVFAPHCEEVDEHWRETLCQSVADGVAPYGLGCDNFVAAHFVNEERVRLVASKPDFYAHEVCATAGEVVAQKIVPELVG